MQKIKNEALNRLSAEEFKIVPKLPLVLVLDNLRSAMNVGSAFRTSDAFRVEKIYLCGFTASPPHKGIIKTALGAQDTVAWEHKESVINCIGELKDKGYHLCSVEQADKSTSLSNFKVMPNTKYAFVFGNEVSGVSDMAITQSDSVIEIPQYGTKHSLNVSVAVGILLWDFVSKLRKILPEGYKDLMR